MDPIKLNTIITENNWKKTIKCVNILIVRLEEVRSGLTKDYQKEVFLKNKNFNAVRDIKAGKLPYFKPADYSKFVIVDLQISLPAVLRPITAALNANFLDLMFRSDRGGRRSRTNTQICFVCNRRVC